MNGERQHFTVTKLRREDGVWRCRVTVGGEGVECDRQDGSWRITPAHPNDVYQCVRPYIAAEIQRQVRAIENARGPRKVTVTNEQAEKIKAVNPAPETPGRGWVAIG